MDWIKVEPSAVMNRRQVEKSAKQFLRDMEVRVAVPVSRLRYSLEMLQTMACYVRAEDGHQDAMWLVLDYDDGQKYFMRCQ